MLALLGGLDCLDVSVDALIGMTGVGRLRPNSPHGRSHSRRTGLRRQIAPADTRAVAQAFAALAGLDVS